MPRSKVSTALHAPSIERASDGSMATGRTLTSFRILETGEEQRVVDGTSSSYIWNTQFPLQAFDLRKCSRVCLYRSLGRRIWEV